MKIEKFYCINLSSRTDRWLKSSQEFKKHFPGMELTRFNAIEKNPGWLGCKESHLSIMGKSTHLKTFMVLEDDFEFAGDINSRLKFVAEELPNDWELLYLGANFRSADMKMPLKRYSKNLFLCQQAFGTYAYIVNNKNGLVDTILNMKAGIRKIDVFYANVIQKFERCFIIYPMCATHADGYSDITRKNTNYKEEIESSFNQIINL
jgi:glycosyl transferase family 25